MGLRCPSIVGSNRNDILTRFRTQTTCPWSRWNRRCRPAWTSRSAPTSSGCCLNWPTAIQDADTRNDAGIPPDGRMESLMRPGNVRADCPMGSDWTIREPRRNSPSSIRYNWLFGRPPLGDRDRSGTRPAAATVYQVVAMATADPAKFPDVMERAIRRRPMLPPSMADLSEQEERFPPCCRTICPCEKRRFGRGGGEKYERQHGPALD